MTIDTLSSKAVLTAQNRKSFEWLISAIKHDLKSVAETGFTYSLQCFENALSTSQQALKNAARETPNQADKEPFIEAMEICQRQSQAINQHFSQQLTAAYSLLTNQVDNQNSTELLADKISRDNDEINNRILVQKLIADAQRHFEKGLSTNTAGLKNSLDAIELSDGNNPFGPNILIECTFQAFSHVNFSANAMQTLLLHFQQSWFTKLGGFYQNLNEKLMQSGVSFRKGAAVPTLKRGISTPDRGFKLDTVESESYKGTPAFNDTPSTHQLAVTDAIGLIQGATIPPNLNQKSYRTLVSTAPKNNVILSDEAVITLISDMQKGYEPKTDGDVIHYIRHQLDLQTKANNVVIISSAAENTINLISLCFHAIANLLPKNLAPLMLRLKPVYARIALDDDFFFHDNLHPARKLLDELLSLINSNFNDIAINRYVQTVVMKVQLKFNGDTALFEQLLSDIEGYLAIEEKRYQSNQDALIQKFSTQENQKLAITACNKYLQEHISSLPSQLEYFDFFKAVLSPALAQQYLTFGGKSDQWRKITTSIQLIFSMLKCSDLNKLRKNAKTLASISMLLSQILTKAKVSITNKQILLEQLQDIQILQMQGNTLNSIYDSQLRFHDSISNYLLDFQENNEEHTNNTVVGHHHSQFKTARFARLQNPMSASEAEIACQQLSIGQWLSILIDQKPMRLQYGFYSRTTQRFVFFNSNHEKVFERDLLDLQKDFETGFSCKIEQTANFDAALEQVSKDLALLWS